MELFCYFVSTRICSLSVAIQIKVLSPGIFYLERANSIALQMRANSNQCDHHNQQRRKPTNGWRYGCPLAECQIGYLNFPKIVFRSMHDGWKPAISHQQNVGQSRFFYNLNSSFAYHSGYYFRLVIFNNLSLWARPYENVSSHAVSQYDLDEV